MEPKKSLQSLVAESLNLSRILCESGGELTPEIESLLSCNEKDLAVKVDGYKILLDQFEAQNEAWKKRADEIYKIAKSFDTARERLKSNIKLAMDMLGTTEIKGESYRFKLSNTSPKLVLNESLIPSEYKKEVTEWVINKEMIRGVLESGKTVEGAQLIPSMGLRPYANTGR